MDIKALTTNLSVSPQVLVNEMEALAQAGFKAIICNRPDGEGPDQPSFKEIEAAAEHYGIQARLDTVMLGGCLYFLETRLVRPFTVGPIANDGFETGLRQGFHLVDQNLWANR